MPSLPPPAIVAKRLVQARRTFPGGMSQRALGMAIGLDEDVAAPRINRYERAVHAPDIQTLLDMAKALDVPAGFLVTEDDALAEAILGFARLPKAKQKAVLAAISEALGPKRAEEVRARLSAGVCGPSPQGS